MEGIAAAPPAAKKPKTTTAADAEFLSQFAGTTTSSASSSVGDLHKTNLLNLQVDELVAASRLDYMYVKWHAAAQEYVTAVTSIIEKLPLDQKIAWTEDCPFRRLSDSDDKKSSSKSRLACKPMGCYHAEGLGMMTPASNAKVLPTLDVRVSIPTEGLVETRDYLKDRYFDKRNAIVWYVAKQLSDKRHQTVVGKLAWRYDYDDARKPILVLEPPIASDEPKAKTKRKKKSKRETPVETQQQPSKSFSKARMRLILHFGMDSDDWIPPLRLVPNRCNLGGATTSSSQAYNQALLEDLPPPSAGGDTFHAIVQDGSYLHWQDALILAQIWCLQRGLLRRHDGWTTTTVAWSLVYLYRTKKASPRMPALQVLQAWWKLLADTDWLGDAAKNASATDENGSSTIRKAPSEAYIDIRDGPCQRAVLVMPLRDGASQAETVKQSKLAQKYAQQTKESPLTPNDPATLVDLYGREYMLGPVLLDGSLRQNLLGRLSPATIRQCQRDARLSLERLHNYHKPFSSLFMKDARFWNRYDAYVRIPLKDVVFDKSNLWGHDRADLGDAESIRRGLRNVLGKALTDRVREIQFFSTGNGSVAHGSYDASQWQDSDEIPTHHVAPGGKKKNQESKRLVSPTGDDALIAGIAIDPDICFRVVDRGPPADDAASTAAFTELWGSKAELRRFKDGAIVHATVWNEDFVAQDDYYHFSNDDKVQGGVVERIIRYILDMHFLKDQAASKVQFSLRNLLSCVDSVHPGSDDEVTFNPIVAHRLVMKAFDSLSEFLRESSRPSIPIPGSTERNSRLGIPLAIDAVEPLAPSLRYVDLFPPIPHPLLGGMTLPGLQKVSQAVQSQPILIQIRFGSSSKWPNDLKAIKVAKTAMLIQMIEGIEALKKTKDPIALKFGDHPVVCADYVDLAFRGYVFRILVRADPELRLLESLFRPTDEARSLLRLLTRRHLTASKHHSIVHAVYTRHASASVVVRLAHRWIATHLLSSHFAFETIELLVAYVYSSQSSPTEAPATVTAGFLRFLDLLATHDWKGEPLVVDPQNTLSIEMHSAIMKEFETLRGREGDHGPPLYVISPSDFIGHEDDSKDRDKTAGGAPKQTKDIIPNALLPSFSADHPEWVVLNRTVALAAKSHRILQRHLEQFDSTPTWSVVFTEPATSFEKYSVLMRIDPDFAVDTESSSTGGKALSVSESKNGAIQSSYTRSMIQRYKGPRPMQRKLFKNLLDKEDIFLEWQPLDAMISRLERELGHLGLFFYNHLCPEVVGVLWRPGIFAPKSFSAIQSEMVRPVTSKWKSDTLVTLNVFDILKQASKFTQDIVTDQKILDAGMKIESSRKRPIENTTVDSSGSSDEDDSD